MPSVLFVCVANSCRSQMAEAVAKSLDKESAWDIWSAGSQPGGRVHPVAIAMMSEIGLDLSGHASKGLAEVPQKEWDYAVTMGCGDACPNVRAKKRLDWQIPDPVAMSPEDARRVRDQIIGQVKALIRSDKG